MQPRTAFTHFLNANRATIKPTTDAAVARAAWEALSAEEKKPFQEKEAADLQRFGRLFERPQTREQPKRPLDLSEKEPHDGFSKRLPSDPSLRGGWEKWEDGLGFVFYKETKTGAWTREAPTAPKGSWWIKSDSKTDSEKENLRPGELPEGSYVPPATNGGLLRAGSFRASPALLQALASQHEPPKFLGVERAAFSPRRRKRQTKLDLTPS